MMNGNGKQENKTSLALALDLIQRGYAPIPLRPKGKEPASTEESWKGLRINTSNAHQYFNGHAQNIGAILGEPSHGLVDVDLDCPEALALVRWFLPPTGLVFGRDSTPRAHWQYTCPGAVYQKYSDPVIKDKKKAVMLELRAEGDTQGLHYTMMPGSIHPSGEAVRWDLDGEPAGVDKEQLERALGWLATASLLVRYWPAVGGRHDAYMALAGGLLRSGCDLDDVVRLAEAICYGTNSTADEKHLRAVRDTADRLERGEGVITGWPTLAELLGTGGDRVVRRVGQWLGISTQGATAQQMLDLGTHDVGNGLRLVQRHGDNLRYCEPLGGWLVWNRRYWEPDESHRIEHLAKETAMSIAEEAITAGTKDRQALLKWAAQSHNQNRIKAMVAMARSEPGVAIKHEQLDEDHWLFNAANGTIDLRTGELRPFDREDLITRTSPVTYDPTAQCPVFIKFLREILGGDEDLMTYVQKAAGYSLTGITSDQSLFILWGSGDNGKTTLIEIFREVLGLYGRTASVETFMEKKGGGGVPNDIARLRGARYVSACEAEDQKFLNEALVKRLTGEDEVAGRFLYKEFFQFHPTFKIWLATNHRPVIKSEEHAIWKRVRLLPFNVTIPRERIDRQLPDKLRAELPGILNWMVEGCLRWQREGLKLAKSVEGATRQYREDMDMTQAFIDEACMVDPDKDREDKVDKEKLNVTLKEIYGEYKEWAKDLGRPLGRNTFARNLEGKGFKYTRIANQPTFIGITTQKAQLYKDANRII